LGEQSQTREVREGEQSSHEKNTGKRWNMGTSTHVPSTRKNGTLQRVARKKNKGKGTNGNGARIPVTRGFQPVLLTKEIPRSGNQKTKKGKNRERRSKGWGGFSRKALGIQTP